MSADDRLRALLGKGYFPKELPPAFTTEDFGHNAPAIIADWESAGIFKKRPKKLSKKKNKSGAFEYDIENAEIESISTPKRGYERRDIHITHPVPQSLLSKEICDGWSQIQKWLTKQSYSLDEIRLSNHYTRSIKGIDFSLHRVKKSYIEATADWLLKTDITRFYPSIYTHSIPWAAYGKDKVKNDLKLYSGSLADRLDVLVRSCNRNQTVGIPVGPETSRILAEIISARIDSSFGEQMPDISRNSVDRLQDDWFVGLPTLEKAEKALSVIIAIYRSYGLDINGHKTSVVRAMAHTDEAWISELGAFLSHRAGPLKRSRLREFLNLALRLQVQYEQRSVTNYALTVLESQRIDVEVVESFLLKAALISPGSMSRICEIAINLEFHTKRISKDRIGKRFSELAERNLLNGNLYEAIWQIYTLRGLGIRLRSRAVCELSEYTTSSSLALVLLDLDSKGLCKNALPKDKWEASITKDRVQSDWIWLLAYEGFRHAWLSDRRRVFAEPFFAAMASRGVAFYDPRRNVRRTAKTVLARKRARKQSAAAIMRFLLDVRGIMDSDY